MLYCYFVLDHPLLTESCLNKEKSIFIHCTLPHCFYYTITTFCSILEIECSFIKHLNQSILGDLWSLSMQRNEPHTLQHTHRQTYRRMVEWMALKINRRFIRLLNLNSLCGCFERLSMQHKIFKYSIRSYQLINYKCLFSALSSREFMWEQIPSLAFKETRKPTRGILIINLPHICLMRHKTEIRL